MTEEIQMLLEAAAKIKQICHDVVVCDGCPFLQGRFCRFVNTATNGIAPEDWVIDWQEYED